LKPEQWGSPLVQEKYQEETFCDIVVVVVTTNFRVDFGRKRTFSGVLYFTIPSHRSQGLMCKLVQYNANTWLRMPGGEVRHQNAHLSSQDTNPHCVRRYCICV